MPMAFRPRLTTRRGVLAAASRAALSATFAVGLTAPAAIHAIPAAAQAGTVSFSTAEAAPADAVSYTVLTLDDRSEQWRLADSLLDRAGFGEAIDQAVAEGLRDETGENLPLDAFLGGEVAVITSETVLDNLAEESMGTADLDAMLEGLGMATPAPAAAGPEAQGVAVVLDARAPDTAWTGIRDAARDEAGSEESTYEGTTITYAPPAGDEDSGMAVARVGDLILIAPAPVDLHPIIDTADGRTPNITTVPEFTTARDALPGEFLSFTFIGSIADQQVDLGPFGAASESLMTDSYTGLTLAADEPGFRMETVTIPAAGATLPPTAAPFESELVGLAPDDALLFFNAADLGATGILDALGSIVIGFALAMGGSPMDESGTPTSAMTPDEVIAQQYEQAAQLIGVNLQTDLFHQLVGEYGGWLSADMESQMASGLFASNVADAETVSNTVRQLALLLQGMGGEDAGLTTRDVDGSQVYVIDLGDGSTLEFGVVGDRFVIGSGTAIDRLAGGAGASLADNTQYQAVMDALPVERNGSLYVDLERALPLLQAASEETDELGLAGMGEITDASEACANYASQEEAQAAYDAAEPDTFDLDQDFDGQVCEDFFQEAGADASPASDGATDDIEAALANVDYSAIKAFALVSHEDGGFPRTSSILYIAE